MTRRVHCSLTRAITLHAVHHYPAGGPTKPHGHLYRIEVTVAGELDTGQSSVIELDTLDAILTERIVNPLGGSDLNTAIPEFASGERLPTCEAFAAWCWRTISRHLPPGASLERVRVAEDATLSADCTGDV